jgi:NADH-quinone oxidoreductase subunit M
MVQRTTQGKLNPALATVEGMKRDISTREMVVVGPLIALLLVLGFYPKPVLDVVTPAVQATFSHLETGK